MIPDAKLLASSELQPVMPEFTWKVGGGREEEEEVRKKEVPSQEFLVV
jgi:hypothetical protein